VNTHLHPFMKLRNLLLPALFVFSVSLSGCATRIATYPGPTRLDSEIAVLPWDSAQEEIHVVSIDGRRITASRPNLEMLPGQHTLEVMYRPAQTIHSYPVKIHFTAQAGHRYGLSAKVVGGKVTDEGVWGGKYDVALFDLNTAREVARSSGRSVPPNLETSTVIRRPAPGRDSDY
jgi:hypothetical protein